MSHEIFADSLPIHLFITAFRDKINLVLVVRVEVKGVTSLEKKRSEKGQLLPRRELEERGSEEKDLMPRPSCHLSLLTHDVG